MTTRARGTYAAAFRAWAQQQADEWAQDKPHIRAFPVDQFDGCTLAPDYARHCCLEHDLAYWYAETPEERAAADREFRGCILELGKWEDRFGWLWVIRAWVWWAAVRVCGGAIVSKRRAAWDAAR